MSASEVPRHETCGDGRRLVSTVPLSTAAIFHSLTWKEWLADPDATANFLLVRSCVGVGTEPGRAVRVRYSFAALDAR